MKAAILILVLFTAKHRETVQDVPKLTGRPLDPYLKTMAERFEKIGDTPLPRRKRDAPIGPPRTVHSKR